MSWSEQELRQTFLASLGAPPGADCPLPEAIWDAINLALPPERRYAIVLHTASCPHCAQAWQAARLITEERPGGGPAEAPKPADPWWRRWLAPSVLAPALAGAAALLVALVWLQPTDPGPVAPPIDSGVMRGLKNAPEPVTADGAALSLGDVLAWHGVAGTIHHKVVMFSRDGGTRLELPATDQLVIAREVIEAFGAGNTVYWSVAAVDGDQAGAESEVRRFVLTNADGRANIDE